MENRIIRKEPLKIGENPDHFSFESEAYDLDLMEIYKKMRSILSNPYIILKASINSEELLFNLREKIRFYCEKFKIDFEYYLKTESPLIVFPYNISEYKHWIRDSLIFYDKFKIPSYLKYHQLEFKKLNHLTSNKVFVDWIDLL